MQDNPSSTVEQKAGCGAGLTLCSRTVPHINRYLLHHQRQRKYMLATQRSIIILDLSFRSSPSVRDAKMGNTPMASTATNIGMKDSRMFLSIFSFFTGKGPNNRKGETYHLPQAVDGRKCPSLVRHFREKFGDNDFLFNLANLLDHG